MNMETTLETKAQLNGIEKKLRLGGERLDRLWMEARSAVGQEMNRKR